MIKLTYTLCLALMMLCAVPGLHASFIPDDLQSIAVYPFEADRKIGQQVAEVLRFELEQSGSWLVQESQAMYHLLLREGLEKLRLRDSEQAQLLAYTLQVDALLVGRVVQASVEDELVLSGQESFLRKRATLTLDYRLYEGKNGHLLSEQKITEQRQMHYFEQDPLGSSPEDMLLPLAERLAQRIAQTLLEQKAPRRIRSSAAPIILSPRSRYLTHSFAARNFRIYDGFFAPLTSTSRFYAGQPLWANLTLSNFKQTEYGEMHLSIDAIIIDEGQNIVYRKARVFELHDVLDLFTKRSDVLPVSLRLALPGDLPVGDYRLRLRASDHISMESSMLNKKFKIIQEKY